jgi:adenine/guanine phosphoribosyltransferase-like PRPP-binding protein
LLTPDTLWVPHRIAMAMVGMGFGKEVAPLLVRTRSVPKAHLARSSKDRSTVTDHYESMRVQTTLSEPGEIVLVDDVVTQGATLLGAANRLASAFPGTPIRAFAIMRTISNAAEFVKEYDPCVGMITNHVSGHPRRRP